MSLVLRQGFKGWGRKALQRGGREFANPQYFHWKIISLAGICTSDLPSTKPMRYQLSYQGLDEQKTNIVCTNLWIVFKIPNRVSN